MQYYPLEYASMVVGTPVLMSLLIGRIVATLNLLASCCTAIENYDSIENLDNFSNRDYKSMNMAYLLIEELC